ncbi:hydroxyisourate hydrolase [Sphingobacterium sp. KU25419]|nr:hydroxyisourate hydrolase [Sphingobacterium sp. KU25419]
MEQKNAVKGVYKLTFLVADYFKSKQVTSFYPFIEVVFEIKDNKHYHVPITLSPFGYSTYRGN